MNAENTYPPWLLQLLDLFVSDTEMREVCLNQNGAVFAFSEGRFRMSGQTLLEEDSIIRGLQEFSFEQGYRLDPNFPVAGGQLENGRFRWMAAIPPVAGFGGVFTLRKHVFGSISFDDFRDDHLLLDGIHQPLMRGKSVLVYGPTGSGKTTLLHCLLTKHFSEKRVVLLEDFSEFPEQKEKNWVHLRTSETHCLNDLLRLSLRLFPDQLVFGELKGNDFASYIDAFHSGHQVLATIHAECADDIWRRFPEYGPNKKSPSLKDSYILIGLSRGTPPSIKEVFF